MKWQPIETAPKETALLLATEFFGAGDWRIKCGSFYGGEWHVWGATWTPSHWMPLPAAPGAPVGTNAAPSGWRTVIDNHCDRLLDTEPSSYDSQGYRDFARSVLDSVADELAALEADPATKRQEAEAIKAEFLERTGQYLTNDASREACIAEAVAAEREACARVCEGMHEEDRPHHYADAIRGRDPVPLVPLTTDGERLHFLLDQLTGWGDRTEEVNSYLHDEEGFPLPRGHALASIDAARAKAAAQESP